MSADAEAEEVYCRDCGEAIDTRAEICPQCGIRQQPPPSEVGKGETEKDAGIAAVAAFVVPGLGQIYNGEIAKGIILGIITIILAITGVGLIIAVPLWIWLIYDAYNTADTSGSPLEDDELPAEQDIPAVIDHVLAWYAENGPDRAAAGRARRHVRDDGLENLGSADLKLISNAIAEYNSAVGQVRTHLAREKVELLTESRSSTEEFEN